MIWLLTLMAIIGVNASEHQTAVVELMQPEISFTINHYEYKPVTFTANEDTEIVLPDNSWIQTAEVPVGVVNAGDKCRFYVAPDGPAAETRTASVMFKGKTSGNKTVLTVSQEAMPVADAWPAKWYYQKEDTRRLGWLDHGGALATGGVGRGSAVITAVGVNNRRLGHVLTTSYKQSMGVSNLYAGDYLLFSVPVKSLPAGSDVDFMLTIAGNDNTAPKYWIAEIKDGGQWRMPDARSLKHADGVDYSFYTRYFPSYQHATFAQSFTLDNPVTDGMLQVRCRVVGDRNGGDGRLEPDNAGAVFLPSHEFHACVITAYPGVPQKDVSKVAVLGNSFTYFNGSPFMLKEIARSQGHRIDLRAHIKGSQSFSNHVDLERSKAVISEPGYDYVILQDQSEQHNKFADGNTGTIVEDTKALTGLFRKSSPDAKIILENTWASPKNDWNTYGSPARHTDRLITGAKAVAQADPNTDWVSPVGVAFETAYNEGIPGLWHTDMKHPGHNGSYLKACVHYLVMYGEPFRDSVVDCECDPDIAARLRDIAIRTVLGHERDYFINR